MMDSTFDIIDVLEDSKALRDMYPDENITRTWIVENIEMVTNGLPVFDTTIELYYTLRADKFYRWETVMVFNQILDPIAPKPVLPANMYIMRDIMNPIISSIITYPVGCKCNHDHNECNNIDCVGDLVSWILIEGQDIPKCEGLACMHPIIRKYLSELIIRILDALQNADKLTNTERFALDIIRATTTLNVISCDAVEDLKKLHDAGIVICGYREYAQLLRNSGIRCLNYMMAHGYTPLYAAVEGESEHIKSHVFEFLCYKGYKLDPTIYEFLLKHNKLSTIECLASMGIKCSLAFIELIKKYDVQHGTYRMQWLEKIGVCSCIDDYDITQSQEECLVESECPCVEETLCLDTRVDTPCVDHVQSSV
jgi:hypothetical protein